MPDILVLEFDTPKAVDLYRKVSGILNVDPSTGSGDWPPPLLHHVAGESGNKLIVVEVWESKAAQEEFMQQPWLRRSRRQTCHHRHELSGSLMPERCIVTRKAGSRHSVSPMERRGLVRTQPTMTMMSGPSLWNCSRRDLEPLSLASCVLSDHPLI